MMANIDLNGASSLRRVMTAVDSSFMDPDRAINVNNKNPMLRWDSFQ